VGSDQRPDLEQLCPEVVIEGDTVCIGEDANTAVLKKDEWNVLVGCRWPKGVPSGQPMARLVRGPTLMNSFVRISGCA